MIGHQNGPRPRGNIGNLVTPCRLEHGRKFQGFPGWWIIKKYKTKHSMYGIFEDAFTKKCNQIYA